MAAFCKARVWVVLTSAAIGLTTLSASARAEVLFDSLDSQNSGFVGDEPVPSGSMGASFDTGASAFRLTDVALLLNTTSFQTGDTFTVSLGGGTPLADLVLVNALGLNVNETGGPVLASVTLPISDLAAGATIENFTQFAGITLVPNAFYAISIALNQGDDSTVGWGTTTDDSGPGVADGYNSSNLTDGGFFPNKPTPPPNNGGPIFQMEVRGVATPEPSAWALMLVGLAGLGLLAHRRRNPLASTRD